MDQAIGHTDTCKACFNGVYPIKEKFIFCNGEGSERNIAFFINKNRAKEEKSGSGE